MPSWLRDMLQEDFPHWAGDTDADLVEEHFSRFGAAWLNEWGTTVIAGQDVFICESDALLDPICLAADFQLGFVLVESSLEVFDVGFTVYFTEGFRTRRCVKNMSAVSSVPFDAERDSN